MSIETENKGVSSDQQPMAPRTFADMVNGNNVNANVNGNTQQPSPIWGKPGDAMRLVQSGVLDINMMGGAPISEPNLDSAETPLQAAQPERAPANGLLGSGNRGAPGIFPAPAPAPASSSGQADYESELGNADGPA